MHEKSEFIHAVRANGNDFTKDVIPDVLIAEKGLTMNFLVCTQTI